MVPIRGHVPVRMCAVCRGRREKSALMRFVCAAGYENPTADPGQKLPGRGIYVCPEGTCIDRFMKGRKRKCKGV